MILVFGGSYQGKLAYALKRFGLAENDVYRCGIDDVNMPEGEKIIYEIDKWILALVKSDTDEETMITRFADSNRDAVVICNDISCGVVPLDPVLRKWREAVGRSMALLSDKSGEVVRLFCGIPARLK